MTTGEIIFEPLPMKVKKLTPVSPNMYSIVAKSGQNVTIEAESAYQAFKLSGFSEAIKIERASCVKKLVLKEQQFLDDKSLDADNLIFEEKLRLSRTPVVSISDLELLMRNFVAEEIEPSHVAAAAGVDVHGDGFDEIIPASMPEKPVAKKVAPVVQVESEEVLQAIEAVEPQIMQENIELPPEEVLSQDEINKLLNG